MFAYSVFDDKAGAYGTPFFAVNDGTASRSFGRLVLDPQSMVSYSPSDYHLYRIADFDEAAGVFLPVDKPEFVAHAITFVDTSLSSTLKPVG